MNVGMRDLIFLVMGCFIAEVVSPWLRRQDWFAAMTSRMAKTIDRIAGY